MEKLISDPQGLPDPEELQDSSITIKKEDKGTIDVDTRLEEFKIEKSLTQSNSSLQSPLKNTGKSILNSILSVI